MLVKRVLSRGGEESGFTMIATLGGVTLVAMLAVVAVTAVSGDIHLTRGDLDRKQAYDAAQAGINDYAFHLHVDNSYWTHCAGVESPSAVNLQGSTAKRRPVPGLQGAEYALELLPSTTQTTFSQCSTANPAVSMLESGGPLRGTFRVRSTGFAGNSKTSIVATFKPVTFLDFVYFTQRETSDPVTYGFANPSAALEGAYAQCGKALQERNTQGAVEPLEKAGRNSASIPNAGSKYCNTISFVKGDSINGPMHTNDSFVICENPKLGRDANDSVEVSAAPPGWYSTKSVPNSGSSCIGNPNFAGTFRTNAAPITPPPTNSELKLLAEEAFRFKGQVRICLSGTSMTVGGEGTCTGLYSGPIPANGIVYVENGVCSVDYSPFTATYPATSGCGNAYVHGEYSGQLTIATENDIIVDGNLTHSGSEAVLGLVANNFVRVYHNYPSEVINSTTHNSECKSTSEEVGIKNITIDAAILAINHSFTVDHYDCGISLGTLTVNGAIAQKFRGAVGTSGNGTGYLKSYNYDDRLRFLEPPSFIEPEKSDWTIGRETIE
jgi:hypothetical protein